MYRSIIEPRGVATRWPDHTGERVYMREFRKRHGLPTDLARWQGVVDQMLDGVDSDGPIYLMVDQAYVEQGQTHRRPGVHIDGYWNPAMLAHGFGSHGWNPPSHGYMPPSHAPIQISDLGKPRKSPVKRKKPVAEEPPKPLPPLGIVHPKRKRKVDGWGSAAFDAPEGIILAANVAGAEGYTGDFCAVIGDGGDCGSVPLDSLQRLTMVAQRVYAGNVTSLHQSIPLPYAAHRSLVRLNVPGWSPELGG